MPRNTICIITRLTTLPILAAAVVLTLAGLTISELASTNESEDSETGRASTAEAERRFLVRLGEGVPELSQEEALSVLENAPTRVAIDTLWPVCEEREKLRSFLLTGGGDSFVRLYLLGLFERESRSEALEAARAIASEEGLGESELLFAAFEILAEHGEDRDLDFFRERPGETPQLKALRIAYRGLLERRTSGGS